MAEIEKVTDKYYGMKPFMPNQLVWNKADRRKCRLTPKGTRGNDRSFITEHLVL